jgi:hypothetical protein
MATDLYGIRVLDVAPDELRVRFRVFVVYYDTESRTHAPLPDDPSFFFSLLREAARRLPIATPHPLRMVDVYEVLDSDWLAAHTHRYVRRIERIATLNHPVAEADWQRLHDFYYERDGRWEHEDLLAQADYDVEVTDARWLESLSPGHGWATASYPITAAAALGRAYRKKATDEPALVAEGAFRLGEMAAEDGDRGRAGELLERAAATGSGEFAERARELLRGLSADNA